MYTNISMGESAGGLEPTLYRPQHEHKGFTQKPSQGAKEFQEHLGISTDPLLRTYYLNREPKFPQLHSLATLITRKQTPYDEFVADKKHRAHFNAKENALFVRENDRFAELYELGHVFIHGTNPGLGHDIAAGFKSEHGIETNIAAYILDEGMAQWIAITLGLKSQDPRRVAEAIKEHNKLVSRTQNSQAVYDPEEVRRKVDFVSARTKAVGEEIIESINASTHVRKSTYDRLLRTIDRDAISIGYVFTASWVSKLLEQPEHSVRSALLEILKNPPGFDGLVEIARAAESIP